MKRMLDQQGFLSPYDTRALSKYHEREPYVFEHAGVQHRPPHVLESQDRTAERLAWTDAVEPALAGCDNFAGHLAWHCSLFHLQHGELERALALHGERIAVHLGRDYRDVANASTLLWRLEREGDGRGHELAALAREGIGEHGLAFADVHYALALSGAGELAAAQCFVTSMRAAAAERAGHYGRAALALAAGQARTAGEKLAPLAASFLRLGGSNAQRDTSPSCRSRPRYKATSGSRSGFFNNVSRSGPIAVTRMA